MRKNLERKTLLIFAVIALSLILLQAGSVSSAEPQPKVGAGDSYIVDGNKVYWEAAGKGRVEVTPHTIATSGWVIINVTSYFPIPINFDFAVGFPIDSLRPADAEVAKTVESLVFYDNSTIMYANWTEINETGQLVNKTNITVIQGNFTRLENITNWTKISSSAFSTVNYAGHKWYFKNATWNPGQSRILRIWIELPEGGINSKYLVAVKRNSDTFTEAVSNGNYVLIDPWTIAPIFEQDYSTSNNFVSPASDFATYYTLDSANEVLSYNAVPRQAIGGTAGTLYNASNVTSIDLGNINSNFTVNFKWNISDTGGFPSFTLSSANGTAREGQNAISVREEASAKFALKSCTGPSGCGIESECGTQLGFSLNTMYFLTINRTGINFSLSVFSDSARTNLFNYTSCNWNAQGSKASGNANYIYTIAPWGDGGTGDSSGSIGDVQVCFPSCLAAVTNSSPVVNVSIANSTSANSTASLASEQLFSNVNYSNANTSRQEVNSTFKWFINNTNQSGGSGNRTTELIPIIYKGAGSYFHFDENGGTSGYDDEVGAITATPNNGVVNVTGIIKGAVQLDGVNDNVTFSGAPTGTGSNYSITLWVKYNALNDGAIYNDFFNTNDNSVLYIGLTNAKGGAANTLKFITFTNGLSVTNTTVDSGIIPYVGTWHHVAATYFHAATSANRQLRIYVDGNLKDTKNVTSGGTAQGGGNFKNIGVFNGVWLNAVVDEFGYWNKTLNASEVKQLYLRTWYDYSPQLFLLQPYKDNSTGLNSSDGDTPTAAVNAKNVTGAFTGTYGVNLTPNGYLNYSATGNFNEREGTVEFWVKPQWNGNDNQAHYIFDGNTLDQFSILKESNGRDNNLVVYAANPAAYLLDARANNWLAGDWHHVAVTWSNYTSNATLHVDGLQINNSGKAFVIPPQPNFILGARPDTKLSNCNCTISEFRISRKALTAQEINLSFSKGRQFFQNEYMLNSSNFAAGDTLKLEYSPKDSTGTAGAAQNSSNLNVHAPKMADEAESDTAIELGINSSVPTATKYKEQQVYVRNLSNNQTLGTFDWVASFGSQRWLFNYVTTGESYVNAPNLTTAVYVLEITDKTSAQITDEVNRLINATKT